MWPKVLLELLPHITRLVPMADKFLSSRSATDDATQQAITGLRSDLAQTASTHAALYRQMNEQSERIAEAADDARATRNTVVALDAKIERLERSLQQQRIFLGLLLLVVVLTLTILILRKP